MTTIVTVVLMVVEAICCLLLIGVILLQRTKGQGLGMAFGGGVGESLFGANMGNVLTKITVILAIVFLVNTTILAFLGASHQSRSLADGITGGAPAAAVPVGGPMGPVSDAPTALPSAEPVAIPATPAPVAIPAAPAAQ